MRCAEQFEDLVAVLATGQHAHVVAGLKSLIAARDHCFAAAGQRPNRKLQSGSKLAPISARVLPASAEPSPMVQPRTMRSPPDIWYTSSAPDASVQFHDLIGGVGVGVDDDVGAHCLTQRRPGFAAQFLGLNADHGLRYARLFRKQRGDQIDLVVLRDASEEVGAIDPRRLQR